MCMICETVSHEMLVFSVDRIVQGNIYVGVRAQPKLCPENCTQDTH